ncbi:Uncharacterised protein [uncultured Butyricicoccus sp.]|nr:Uncharacterised protein [uncultured Butyricicoccus sp.]
MMSAGAVANEGIAVKIGANRVDTRNRPAVTRAVRPVRPPTATPEADSTNVVVVEVPSTAPAEVAIASDSRAGLMRGSLPSLSSISALVATPISVPRVSKISTNRNEKITTIKLMMPTVLKSTLKHWPNVRPSLVKSVMPNAGNRE